jgi:ATP-binding cassette subfamily F protein 3
MESVTTHTAVIHRQKIRKFEGGTAKAYAQIVLEDEIHEKTRANEDRKRSHAEAFINRFRAQASKAKMVQSRIKMLEKLPKLDELAEIESLVSNSDTPPLPPRPCSKRAIFHSATRPTIFCFGISI